MGELMNYARLLKLMIRDGRVRPVGIDFVKRRFEAVQDLVNFLPSATDLQKHQKTDSAWRNLVGHAAFVRRSLNRKGGHLTVSNLKLAYIRIPKAASTALSWAMLCARYPDLKEYSLSEEKINFLTDGNLSLDLTASERQAVFFTAVRNPFSRIVSVYRQFFETPSPFFLYDDYLFGILSKSLSFGKFVKAIQSIPDALKDQHFLPQHRFISFYLSRNLNVRTFKLEEPAALDAFLSSRHLTLSKMNQSESYDYRAYYDRDSLERVYLIYENDITAFGYEGEWEALRRSVEAQTDRSLRG